MELKIDGLILAILIFAGQEILFATNDVLTAGKSPKQNPPIFLVFLWALRVLVVKKNHYPLRY